MIEGYQAGQTLKELGKTFGVSRTTVSSILKREGIQIRNQSLGPEAINLAVELYISGLSLVEVGKQLECDPSTVRLALIAADEPRRDTHGRMAEL
jgi:DNA-directed RNA polymerase specialized sigma24 family protein